MGDPLAVRARAAFQAFRVRLTVGDGFRDSTGCYSYNVLLNSAEWGEAVAASDAYAQAEGLPPFGGERT